MSFSGNAFPVFTQGMYKNGVSQTNSGKSYVMKTIRLMIIEEHTAVRTALETRLRSSSGIEVVGVAATVEEGQPLICVHKPDVVLLGLTSSSKRDLSTTIREVGSLTKCGAAVIVLVSYADDIERELFLHTGTQRYLVKDINSTQLIAEIEAVAAETAVSGE